MKRCMLVIFALWISLSSHFSAFASSIQLQNEMENQVGNKSPRVSLLECGPMIPVLRKTGGGLIDPISEISDPAQWVTAMIQLFKNISSGDQFDCMMRYAREYISYSIFGNHGLEIIHAAYKAARADIETSLRQSESTGAFKWPHQNLFQAYMGHLFFPVQCEDLYEPQAALELREHLQNMLAIAAYYKNTLAQRYMVEILPLFESHQGAQSESPKATSRKRERKETPFERYFGSEADGQLDDYTVKLKDMSVVPLYFCGLLNTMQGNMPLASSCFKSGYEMKDSRCTSRYVQSLKKGEFRERILGELFLLHTGFAYLQQARALGDREKRIEAYCKAGDEGIAEGYRSAGFLALKGTAQQKAKAYGYFLLAARYHILDAYDNLVEILIEEKNYEEAKVALRLKGDCGDTDGYLKLGDQLLTEGDVAEALKWYEKAGMRGFENLHRVAPEIWNQERIEQMRSAFLHERYTYLLRSIKDEVV